MTDDPSSMEYYLCEPPDSSVQSFVEIRKLATGLQSLAAASLTLGENDSLAHMVEEIKHYITLENREASISMDNINEAKELRPIINPKKPINPGTGSEKYLPNWKIRTGDKSCPTFTLNSKDVGREVRVINFRKLPTKVYFSRMKAAEWKGICNLIYYALSVTEASGSGLLLDYVPQNKKSVKRVLVNDVNTAVHINVLGLLPNGSTPSRTMVEWAKTYVPFPEAPKKDRATCGERPW
jgi:hypothetical protein